ncbi:MAG: hypothetical protein ABFD97_18270 [Syntrophobacter sp.]
MPGYCYDHPTNNIRRDFFAGEAGGAGTTEYCKFRTFMASKLKKVHAVVTVAGTVAGHAFDIYHNTSSIGSLALGTSAAGVKLSSTLLDEVLASLDQVSVKSKADTAGKAHIIFEYQNTPDSIVS